VFCFVVRPACSAEGLGQNGNKVGREDCQKRGGIGSAADLKLACVRAQPWTYCRVPPC